MGKGDPASVIVPETIEKVVFNAEIAEFAEDNRRENIDNSVIDGRGK